MLKFQILFSAILNLDKNILSCHDIDKSTTTSFYRKSYTLRMRGPIQLLISKWFSNKLPPEKWKSFLTKLKFSHTTTLDKVRELVTQYGGWTQCAWGLDVREGWTGERVFRQPWWHLCGISKVRILGFTQQSISCL